MFEKHIKYYLILIEGDYINYLINWKGSIFINNKIILTIIELGNKN